jgi:hypothetical protein
MNYSYSKLKIPNKTTEKNEQGERTLLIEITADEAKIIRDALKRYDKLSKNDNQVIEKLDGLRVKIKEAHNMLWPS